MNEPEKIREAHQFLHTKRLMVIGTLSHDAKLPQSSLVYYFADKNSDIIFATTTQSRKLKNLSTNPDVSVLIGQENNLSVLQIEGTAKIVHDLDEKLRANEILSRIANQNSKTYNLPPILMIQHATDSHWAFVRIIISHFRYSIFEGTKDFILEGTGDMLKTCGRQTDTGEQTVGS